MRTFLVFLIAMLGGCSATSAGSAQAQGGSGAPPALPLQVATTGGEAPWLGAAPLSHKLLEGGNGHTHLGVWVDVPRSAAGDYTRPPMALSLVVDASGSMAGAKIRHARIAAARMVESLSDGDMVSLYAFDHRIMEIAPQVVLNPRSRERLLRQIADLRDGGNTNMHGGIAAGQQTVREAPDSHPIRRVLVISDGLANVGPSSPEAFAALAEQGTEHGIQISSIGVGLNYDEHTLGALAMHSEGRMYHLAEPQQMAAILEQELELLGRTVATDAYVEVTPARGVTLDGLEKGRSQKVGRKLLIPLGNLFAGQERELLVRVQVDTAGTGERKLADVKLVYEPQNKEAVSEQHASVALQVTSNMLAVEKSYDTRVESLLASYRASEEQRKAAELLNAGKTQQAASVLAQAEEQLQIAVDKAPSKKKAKLRRAKKRAGTRKRAAQKARTRSEARGAALGSFDDAMELNGY